MGLRKSASTNTKISECFDTIQYFQTKFQAYCQHTLPGLKEIWALLSYPQKPLNVIIQSGAFIQNLISTYIANIYCPS